MLFVEIRTIFCLCLLDAFLIYFKDYKTVHNGNTLRTRTRTIGYD